MKYSRLLSAIMTGRWMIRPEDVIANDTIIRKLLDRQFNTEEYNSILSDKRPFEVLLSADHTSKVRAEGSQYDSLPNKSTAIFSLTGTMLKYGTWCSYGTQEVADAIREAVSHPKIDSVILDIDSGGGAVDAIPPMVEVIQYAQSLGKPVIALVDLCASAAYFTAVHCDEIIANNTISSEIGSIGVMMGFRDYSEYYAKNGIKEHVIYSSHSDWKNLPFRQAIEEPKEGEDRYALLRSEMLDPLAVEFQNTVKAKRPGLKSDVDGIISGRMFFASQALDNGLIDSIGNMQTAVRRCKDLSVIYQYKFSK
ncbi:MAG: S49 family peptidase [Paludibacter sp.]|nr:S49 family peptidase [Paludibacter sp.]